MLSVSRKVAFVLLAALALVATGCGGSNNKGKIVGKWKMTGGGVDDKMPKEMADKMYLMMEFKDDGTAGFSLVINDPEMKKFFEASKENTSATFKYKLLKGDEVELYDLPKEMQNEKSGFKKDRAKATIKINGDDMTMVVIDDDKKEQTVKLTKIK